MRFLALEAHVFGPLRARSWELEANVFVVYGPNEAGKSSFHSALRTILYGFERPKRSDHPLHAFGKDNEDLALRARLRLDSGEVLDVERRLMSYAKLIVRDQEGREIRPPQRNEALAEIQSLPSKLFDAVYSLTANDTTMQTDEVHEHIQELLLGETGLRGARPIAEVRRELLADRDQLWRPDGRGKPLAKQQDEALRVAEKELRQLRREDKQLRDAREELERLLPQIDHLQRIHRSLQHHRDRLLYAARWNRYRSKLRVVEGVRARLAGLPEEVRQETIEDPERLAASIRRQESALREPRNLAQRTPPSLTPDDARWWQTRARIQSVLKAWPDYRDLSKDGQQAKTELERYQQELRATLQRLGVPVQAAPTLAQVATDPLRLAAKDWQADRDAHQERSQHKAPSRWWVLFAALACMAAVGLWWLPGYGIAWLGMLLVSFAVCLVMLLRPSHRVDPGSAPAMPALWVQTLSSLELDPADWTSPSALQDLAGSLERYQELHQEARQAHARKEALGAEWERASQPWLQLIEELELSPQSPEEAYPEILSRWELVSSAAQDVREQGKAYAQAQEILKQQQPALEADRARLARIQLWLQTAFPDRYPLGEAMQALQEYRDTQAVVASEGEELRAESLYAPEWETSHGPPPGGEDVWRQALGEAEEGKDWQVADCDAALQRLEQEQHEKHARKGSLEEILKERSGMRLAQAFEERNQIRAAQQETMQRRDALALLARLFERAEARHRETHQPDVLARAGEYLQRITEGRYLALQYPPESANSSAEGVERPVLQVHSKALGWRPVGKPLSRGTQEQIYLALRLGTLDYLDRGRESLPLVLDEALVHWDLERRTSLYAVLRELSERRQVILFTCHEAFAREVEEHLDARRIELSRA